MPTIISHGVLAAGLGNMLASGRLPARFWVLSVLCSILPDFDVVSFHLGIRYEDMLGHRGLTHSLAFALASSLIVVFVAFPRLPRGWSRLSLISYFFVVTASHGFLDAMTDGGLGIAFFAPFDDTRYFLPFRPIRVSPIGRDFLGAQGLDVIMSEIVWVWFPVLAIVCAVRFYRHLR